MEAPSGHRWGWHHEGGPQQKGKEVDGPRRAERENEEQDKTRGEKKEMK